MKVTNQETLPALNSQLHGLIEAAPGQALRAVDSIQVRTCWEIGRYIVKFEQQGTGCAMYGARLIFRLAKSLTGEFERGFDASNLNCRRLFYPSFSIRDVLRHELSWIYDRNLLRVDSEQARIW